MSTSATTDRNPPLGPFWRVVVIGIWYFALATVVALVVSGATGSSEYELWELVFYAGLSLASPLVLNRYLDRRRAAAIGVFWDRWVGRDLVAGVVFGLVTVGVQAAAYVWITSRPLDVPPLDMALVGAIVGAFVLHSIVALTEELQDRGHLLTTVIEWTTRRFSPRTGVAIGIVFVSIFFSLSHLPETSGRFIGLTFSGILYGLAYVWTGRLGLSIGMHWGYNVGVSFVTWGNYVVVSIGIVEAAMIVVLGAGKLLFGLLLLLLWIKVTAHPGEDWNESERFHPPCT